MSIFGIACLRCQKCNYSWGKPPGPTECPKCGHAYLDWLNFKQWQEMYEKYKMGL